MLSAVTCTLLMAAACNPLVAGAGADIIKVQPPVYLPRCGIQHDMGAVNLEAEVNLTRVDYDLDESFVQFQFQVNGQDWNMLCMVRMNTDKRGKANRLGCYNHLITQDKLIVRLNQLARRLLSEANVTVSFFEEETFEGTRGDTVKFPLIYEEARVFLHFDEKDKNNGTILDDSQTNSIYYDDLVDSDDFNNNNNNNNNNNDNNNNNNNNNNKTGDDLSTTSQPIAWAFITIHNLRSPFEIYYEIHGERRGIVKSPTDQLKLIIKDEDLFEYHPQEERSGVRWFQTETYQHRNGDDQLLVAVHFNDSACARHMKYMIEIKRFENAAMDHGPSKRWLLIGCLVGFAITWVL